MSKVVVRGGNSADLPALFALDHIARSEPARRLMIKTTLASDSLWVAEVDEAITGYGIMTYSFYGRAFIDMIYVDENQRGLGVGPALIETLENQARTERIFTSTNQSNRRMQQVLAKLGYAISGVINDLDFDDPEIVYSKSLVLSS